MASTGMIIDGVLGSQCVDSSGEILDVEGADISDLEEGRGVLNYEHKGAEDKDSNGQEIVGKILAAKKIFSEKDCDNAREKAFWSKVKHPFIYGVCRLYDGAGHEGAKALAAQIRDHHANGEPILVRFSVEGSTLEKDGNVLKRSVIRRVALTLKPCNRTADSGLVEDPNAPQGFEKKPVQKVGDILADLTDDAKKMEHQHPGYQKLGGVTETEYVEFSEDDHTGLVKALAKLKTVRKAMTAGGGDAAPSQLSGGAALQREDFIRHKPKAMSVLKTFLDKNFDFEKSDLIATLKQELPEASDSFIDHFANIAEDYKLKLRKKDEGESPYPKLNPAAHPEPIRVDRSKEEPGVVPQRIKGGIEMKDTKLMVPRPGIKRVAGMPAPGRVKLQQHFPNDDLYQAMLKPDEALEAGRITPDQHTLFHKTIHDPWHRAMSNWLPLNKALSEGKVPKGIIAKSVIFAAMSPNTAVPNQELFYGHYMDMLNEGKVDPFKPFTEDNVREFTQRSTSGQLPVWNREHYEQHRPELYGQTGSDDEENKGDLPQIRGLRTAHMIFPRIEHLTAKYKDDTQGIASELMDIKHQYENKNKRTHPDLDGYGPKLTRYMLGMYGGGNMIVPDRHMIRSTFDLELKEDPKRENKFISPPILDKLQTGVFTDAKNEPFLRAIDHNFFTKHPAVKHVLEQFPKHFAGREQQAIFPAFWLHWLTIGHYDRMRGRPSMAFNADTDHQVFWDSVRDEMIKHGLNPHPIHEGRVADDPEGTEDDSFNFGANLGKAEGLDPWPRHHANLDQPTWLKAAGCMEALRQRWGETPALLAFFSHIAPKLMKAETPVPPVTHRPHPAYHPHLFKMEGLLIDLRKAMSDAATAGDRGLAEIAPYIHHVYRYRVGPDNRIKRHQTGRFTTAGNHLHILEDYHGDLKGLLSEGPLTEKQAQQMANLRSNHKFDTASMHEINSGARPELWVPTAVQSRPPSVFEFYRNGQEKSDRLEFKDGRAHLNGHPLDHAQTQSLLQHVKNGHATVRYTKVSGEAVKKMELVLETIMKADAADPQAAGQVHEALGKLDELVRAGYLAPHHAEALRSHAFTDPMTGSVMGNKFAYTDFRNRADSKQGIHIMMDGNDFKSVNDKYGHEAGDRAIKAMGNAAREAMDEAVGRDQGKLFRVGGDEFAAHVPTHEHAAKFARALRQKLEGITPLNGEHKLTMGIGIGLSPEHADQALYQAKLQKYDPAGMIGPDSRKWISKYLPGTAPNLAHSLVPGFEGPVPLDHSQLAVKPPPAPQPHPPAPEPVVHTPVAAPAAQPAHSA